MIFFFFFSSRRRHTRFSRDWSSDVCSSDLDGVTRTIKWPANECFAVRIESADRDLVVLRGVEPRYRWKSFCGAVLTVAAETGCEMVVTLGALLADVPHTRPTTITGAATDTELIERDRKSTRLNS